MKNLLEAGKNETLNLKFQVADIISACQVLSTELSQRYQRNNTLSSKSPLRSRISTAVPSVAAMDVCLFEVLFEMLIPPSVALKNQFAASRTTSYSHNAFPNGEGEVNLTPSISVKGGSSATNTGNMLNDGFVDSYRDSGDLTNGNSSHNSMKSPLIPTKIQFDSMKDDYFSSSAPSVPNSNSNPQSNRESNVQSPATGLDDIVPVVGDVPPASNSSVIEILNTENDEDFPAFDVNEFLTASNDEYENMMSAVHNEAKRQVLIFLQNIEKK